MPLPVRFFDRDGYVWQAVEVATVSPGSPPGALYFFSRFATRRLAGYPRDWFQGGWDELDTLRRRADSLSSGRAWSDVPA